jgi:hypothetical protein
MMPEPYAPEERRSLAAPFAIALALVAYVFGVGYIYDACAAIGSGPGRVFVTAYAEIGWAAFFFFLGWLCFRFAYDADYSDDNEDELPGAA